MQIIHWYHRFYIWNRQTQIEYENLTKGKRPFLKNILVYVSAYSQNSEFIVLKKKKEKKKGKRELHIECSFNAEQDSDIANLGLPSFERGVKNMRRILLSDMYPICAM